MESGGVDSDDHSFADCKSHYVYIVSVFVRSQGAIETLSPTVGWPRVLTKDEKKIVLCPQTCRVEGGPV